MADETTTIIKQEEGDEFALDHNGGVGLDHDGGVGLEHKGGVALYGDREQEALRHQHHGVVLHETAKPLVHVVCWDEEAVCGIDVKGEITLRGDEKTPIAVNMTHSFANDHHQTLAIEPFEHAMRVPTKVTEPIHHALQMRTPLELRFCNPWQVDSNYGIEVTMGDVRLFSIRLRGATRATPEPCDDQPKQPVRVHAVRTLV